MSIPKKIHLIWVGGTRPPKFDYLINEIKRINHDYDVIEWTDNNIDFELINQNLFDQTENFGAKSDILRFELLYRYGGIYMDYDFLQIKPFDDLLDYDFFAGTNKDVPNEVWNSIVGSVKDNELCKKFVEGLKDTKPIKKHEIDRVMNETGPYYLMDLYRSKKWDFKHKIFIGDYFFPFPATQRHRIRQLSKQDINYIKTFITNNTYTIHLHTTTWQ